MMDEETVTWIGDAMNVKPGDIARVVAPYVIQGRGAIVEVVRLASVEDYPRLGFARPSGSGWLVSGWVRDSSDRLHGHEAIIGDIFLRPLPPPETESTEMDETELKTPENAV